MRIPGTFCVLLSACCTTMTPSQAGAVETLWTYHSPSGHIASSPAVGDINGDGLAELVIATTGGSVIALDGEARQLWRRDVGGVLTNTPTLSDIAGDSALELLIVDNAGVVRCLDAAAGAPMWDRRLPSHVNWGTSAIVAQDINHDGVVELITGDAEGTVVCLTGDGELVWRYQGRHGFTRCPAVGDLDGDGYPEIVIGGSKSPLVCLSHKGEELWRINQDALGSSPVIGETESVALNIFNFGSTAQTLRVEPGPVALEGSRKAIPAKQVLTLHEVIDIPTMTMDLSADALPTMNQGSTLTVPAWGARQLWLNIDTSAIEPGKWSGEIRLRTLQPESLELTAPLALTVWPTALPEKQPLRLCHWGYVARSILQDQPEAALKDQVSHGTNVFVAAGYAPRAQYDENGDLVGEVDYSRHDEYVRRHAPHGTILFCGYGPGVKGDFGSPAYRKAHVAYLRAWVNHLTKIGVGYDGFALYPVDEMGLHAGLVERFFEHAKLAKEADPKIRMYTDPAPGVTVEELEMTRDYVDIWCPSTSFVFQPELAEKFALMKNSGSTLWFYQCAGEAKHMSPLAYYRGQAWLAWQYGATGIGYWTYCTGSDDPWFSAPAKNEHMLIYHGDGIVASKRWEAIRDGIEDYSMFVALREAAQAAAAAGKAPAAVREAEELLGERTVTIAKCVHADEPGTSPSLTGHEGIRPIADRIWLDIQSIREEMARLLAVLTKQGA